MLRQNRTLITAILFAIPTLMMGQSEAKHLNDTTTNVAAVISTDHVTADTLAPDTLLADTLKALRSLSDSLVKNSAPVKLHYRQPDPKRALWLALVLPGAGQIYNHKYWKLPIIYGGFLGCTYALLWNQQMYKDYTQAYLDIMDDDPTTASYNNMLPYGYDITGREEQFKSIFKRKKDFYRKNRDLSIFAFFGVYLLSVIDAYVDAQLSTFDITPDLSMKVGPTVIEQKTYSKKSGAVGVQCSLNF
jgi:hypothetical protein